MKTEIVWDIGEGKWLQDDDSQRFYLSRHQNRDFSKSCQELLPIIIGARTHSTTSSEKPCISGVFPPEFEHCPYCGEKLHAFTGDHDFRWLPPYGDGNGLKVLEHPGFSPDTTIPKAVEFSMPRLSGYFSFMVEKLGSKHAVLLAIDRSNGAIDVFVPNSRQWISLEHDKLIDDALQIPDWAWSIASDTQTGKGFCWPTNSGPCWVDIDWSELRFNVTPASGKCISGVANMANRIYALTLEGGRFVVQVFDIDTRQWSALPLDGPGPQNGEYYGVPIVDNARNRIHWVGASGRFTLRQDGNETKFSWRPWETDAYPCYALPEYGPPYLDRVRNRYWQLCFDEHDQTYRFYEIEGDEQTDLHDNIEGDMLTTGNACFSKEHDHWNAPWDTPTDDQADHIRFPLLQFHASEKNSAVVTIKLSGEQLIWELFKSTQDHRVHFSIESRHNLPRALELPEILKTKRPWEYKAFIFESYLHIYVPDRFKCYRWPIKPIF